MKHTASFVLVLLLVLVLVLAACASRPDDSSVPKLAVASLDVDSYTSLVQPVFERRCGSLDCHGQLPRGLRVYGEIGLRLPNDAGLVPGGGATTPEEALATYQSIMGLQPEKMDAFLLTPGRTQTDAYQLLILTKGTAIERHRGGPAIQRGEPAEQCIVTWLLGSADPGLCATGGASP
jgi:hypothetical protein